jgi:hypothetical protein
MTKLSVRPLIEQDIPFILSYWFDKSDADFNKMGADKTKFPARQQFDEYLHDLCHTPLKKIKTLYMIWLINGNPVGYSALKDITKNKIGAMHLHMWNAENRGKGYGAKLFCMSALQFYEIFKFKLMLCEPKATNPAPNSMLTKIGFKKWKTSLSASSDVSVVCENNSYIIDKKTALSFLEKNSSD